MNRKQFLQGLHSSITALENASGCINPDTTRIIMPIDWAHPFDVLQTGDKQVWIVHINNKGHLYAYSPDTDSVVIIEETDEEDKMNAVKIGTLLPIGSDGFIEQEPPEFINPMKLGETPEDWDKP